MARTLRGAVAIVTGASSGIGRATALELGRRGTKMVLAARRAEDLESLAGEITSAGGEAVAVPTDVTDDAQLEALARRAEAVYGQVDVLVNNAGIGGASFVKAGPEDIVRINSTNLLAPMLLSHAVLPGMLARKSGVIISIASVAGHIATDPLYSGSKFGLRGFSLGLRRRLRGTGVTACLVSPGFIRTPLNGNRSHLPGPEIVARAVADLAVRPRRELVVPRYYRVGIVLERMLPGTADRVIGRR